VESTCIPTLFYRFTRRPTTFAFCFSAARLPERPTTGGDRHLGCGQATQFFAAAPLKNKKNSLGRIRINRSTPTG